MHKYSCFDSRGNYLGSVSAQNKAGAWRAARGLYGARVTEIIKSTYSY
jgi:hypothetical protein